MDHPVRLWDVAVAVSAFPVHNGWFLAFPRVPNITTRGGRAAKKALPEPKHTAPSTSTKHPAPSTSTTRTSSSRRERGAPSTAPSSSITAAPSTAPSTHAAAAPSTQAPSRSSTQHPAPSTSNYRTVLVENGVSCLQRGVPPLPVRVILVSQSSWSYNLCSLRLLRLV